ncbi:MAG: hypothetical protein HQK79_23240 [Desulfobacterales bacterium]|nr:hypothetical protein [Desulfobacterales bacterium]
MINTGNQIIQQKFNVADKFWNKQVEQFEAWNEDHPNALIQEPETTTYNDIVFSYSGGSSSNENQKSYRDAIWIKAYNGADNGHFIFWDNKSKTIPPEWGFHEENKDGINYVELICEEAP